MALTFFSSPKNTLEALSQRSAEIFDVFTKTQKDCLEVNGQIAEVISTKEQEIKALQEEVGSLNLVRTKNQNLATKIETFLNS